MRNVICCWCNTTTDEFESNIPLYFCGARNQKLAFEGTLDILFLSGRERLTEEYKQRLKAVGYQIHDVSAIYREFANKYTALDRFSDYEKKCFLRWPVIATYFAGEPITHYDGDVVFNESPAVIARALDGKTFVLQGCPALTVINDQSWFAQYRQQLNLFVNNIQAYSELAWKEREGWEISEREKWAGQRFREIISSDQDLLSHLIHTDRIIQGRPSDLLRDLQSYSVFENPLYLHGYENNLHGATYERISGVDYIAGKRVLLWHMQSEFTRYLGTFIFRRKYLKRRLSRLTNCTESTGVALDYRLHDLFIRYLHGKTNRRLAIYRYFFEDNDFGEVLTGKTWWHEGAFA
jgi:hypothetical protein